MAILDVTDRDGRRHRLETAEGWRVMEIIRDWDVPLDCECGGSGACGQCRIEVADAWRDRLPPRTPEEEERLDEMGDATPNTRLACQIIWTDELDGLKVTIPARQPAPA